MPGALDELGSRDEARKVGPPLQHLELLIQSLWELSTVHLPHPAAQRGHVGTDIVRATLHTITDRNHMVLT